MLTPGAASSTVPTVPASPPIALADDLANRLRERQGLRQLIGGSVAFGSALQKLPQIARHDIAVLLTGETGTGKELCARAIHYLSRRAARQFVAVNCGALPTELVENELFGHTAGAYTGASKAAEGLVQEAEGGTLFLDEVDSLPALAQVKLLRLLQEKEFRPVGGHQTQRADVRILAAANSDLQAALRTGRFRTDLFYRLSVMPLHLPPLRERRDDLAELANYFLQRYAAEFGSLATGLSPAALAKLTAHDWPGNIRELENVIQRAVLLAAGERVELADIQFDGLVTDGTSRRDGESNNFQTLKAQAVAEFERQYITDLLRTHDGNITHAAKAAGKNRRAFWELMRKHRLSPARPENP